ncbi:MAG: hypothetical protein FRX49_00698 [Trebouxia sp. A1-2]|nr:MAG: hypothetical protein FRX49_00698 [Trebouxia sp. A1-2]
MPIWKQGMPLRQLLYSPIPFSFAALWKYALQIALRTMSQSDPEEQDLTETRLTSLEQPISAPMSSILAKGGSKGNSTILRPSLVSSPVFPRAPSTHS